MSRRQRGVALAIVVWFMAAMSVVVAGIVAQARSDVRMAQLHVARAQATAAGDGAIQLILAELAQGQLEGFQGRGVPTRDYRVGEQQVTVQLVPVKGLIGLNSASRPVLEMLFNQHATGAALDPQVLVDNVIQWRRSSVAAGGAAAPGGLRGASRSPAGRNRFEAVEDLLNVEGVTRTLLDGVRDAVHAQSGAYQGLDWRSAPAAVLNLLPENDPRRQGALDQQTPGQNEPLATAGSGLGKARGRAASGKFRVDAYVAAGDLRILRRRWATVGRGSRGALPWKFTRSEAARIYRGS